MDILFRGTILGQCLRAFGFASLSYAEERNPAVVTNLATLHIARVNAHQRLIEESDEFVSQNETTALLADGQAELGSDALLVDWYDPQDPENPLNWPLSTRVAVTAVVCVLTVSIYAGSSLWSVCIDDAISIFGVPEVVAQLGTSLFVLGFGLGPMIFSPLSEMPSVGRLKVYFWTTFLYICCQLPIPLCNNIEAILVLRFFTGVLCSPVLAVGGGTVADMFDSMTRGYPLAFWELATWGGSALGPVYGGYTFERFGYKGPMWIIVGLAVFSLLLVILFIPETMSTAILHQRARRLRRNRRYATFVTLDELAESKTSAFASMKALFVKGIALNFQEPIVFVLNLYVALVFAIFFGTLESFPYVFKDIYGFSTGQAGLTFLGLLSGGIVSMCLYIAFLRFYQDNHFDKDGNITPEERLLPAIVGGICIPIGMFWYGWAARPDVHWIMPVIGGFWFGLGMFTIFMAMLSYLPDAYPSVAATVIAGNCLLRALLAAAFPLFTIQFYSFLGAGWASTILGALGCIFVPYPFFLYRHGKKLRMKSKNARKDI